VARGNLGNLGKYAHPKGGRPEFVKKVPYQPNTVPPIVPQGLNPLVAPSHPVIRPIAPPPTSGPRAKPPFVLGPTPKRKGK
jgi:hypothetical protein